MSEYRTASKLIADAMLSMRESTREARMLTEPVQSQAASLTATKTRAVRTEAYVTRRSCLPYVVG